MKLNRDDEPVVLTDMRPLSVPRLVRGEQRAEKLRFIAQLLFALAGWVFIYAWLSSCRFMSTSAKYARRLMSACKRLMRHLLRAVKSAGALWCA